MAQMAESINPQKAGKKSNAIRLTGSDRVFQTIVMVFLVLAMLVVLYPLIKQPVFLGLLIY